MKKFIYILAILPALIGCSNFLDVNPKSEVTDDDMFSSAVGYEDALYGIYASLGNGAHLYGKDLSMSFPETMSGNFNVEGDSGLSEIVNTNWNSTFVKTPISDIWKSIYATISNVNNIIKHADAEDLNRFRYMKVYKGEAYALRALLHFEAIRYFAVSPLSANAAAKQKAIPYVIWYKYNFTDFSSVDQAYDLIIKDLKIAEENLAADQTLLTAQRNNAAAGFTSCRMLHMNLYAVQALLARVYWTRGNMKDAAIYAHKVIDSKKFPLLDHTDFLAFDRGTISLKETVFGVSSTDYVHACYQSFISHTTSTKLSLVNDCAALYADYGPGGADYRWTAWFDGTTNQFIKLVNPIYTANNGDKDPIYKGSSILGYNAIRIPEMYYIIAESLLDTDAAEATKYLDYVIASRGMMRYAERTPSQITAEDIYRERRKEFYGEGQQWHNMKRLKRDIHIANGVVIPGTDDHSYTMPIPVIEDENRN